jgi:hypothetical protein
VFTDKEKFITAMTIYVTSETARKIPREKRQAILLYIRNTYCPSVTDADWSEIAQDINNHREEFLQHASGVIAESDENPDIVMGDSDLSKLDSEIHDSPDMDLNDLQGEVDNVSEADNKKFDIKGMFSKIKKSGDNSETDI